MRKIQFRIRRDSNSWSLDLKYPPPWPIDQDYQCLVAYLQVFFSIGQRLWHYSHWQRSRFLNQPPGILILNINLLLSVEKTKIMSLGMAKLKIYFPLQLCSRGRIHVFKYLEIQAIKEDRKRGVLTDSEYRRSYRKTAQLNDFRFFYCWHFFNYYWYKITSAHNS